MRGHEFPSKLVEKRYGRVTELLHELEVLPTSMHVPMRILSLQRAPNSTLKQFADAISSDASLASKVLSLANSAWFSPRKPIHKVSDAVPMIGLNNLLPLLFGVSIAGLFNRADLPSSERQSFWRTSLFKATVARQWAKRCAPELGEEAFLCALLQDVAVPVMSASDRAASLELAMLLESDNSVQRAEREAELYGADHGEFGATLVRQMGLPKLFVDAVKFHHVPPYDDSGWPAELTKLAPALWLAATVPHGLARPDSISPGRLEKAFQFVATGVASAPEFADFIREIGERFTAIASAMGDSDGGENSGFKDFLREVCARIAGSLCGALGESARTIGDLRTAKSDLEGRVITLSDRARDAELDPLTGALNRRGFLLTAQRMLDEAASSGKGCAIGFVDLDDFKRINDEFGHDTGDAALLRVARMLGDTLKPCDGVVGRMGGDEFAFLLTHRSGNASTESIKASREALRQEVVGATSGLSVTSAANASVPLSCSVGLFWVAAPKPGERIDALLRCADKLMYDAKRAGKGRIVDADARQAA